MATQPVASRLVLSFIELVRMFNAVFTSTRRWFSFASNEMASLLQQFFKIPFYLQSVLAYSANCVKTCI
jgi:hypothetical protein